MRKLLEANMSVDDLKSVRRMYRRDNYTKFSDHAFGSRFKKRMVIPLQPPKSKHKKEVEKHISSLGFIPHDYHAGIAKDKHGRDVKSMPYRHLKAALDNGRALSRKYAMHAVNNWKGGVGRS